MQTTPFLFFLERTGGLGNRQSQIATPLQCQGTALQAHARILVPPCHDGGTTWGPGGGCSPTEMVASPEGMWCWKFPCWKHVPVALPEVDTTTDVLFPAYPCRDVLMGFVGVLNVTSGVEDSGGQEGTWPGALGHHRTWGHTIPTCSCPQPFYLSN